MKSTADILKTKVLPSPTSPVNAPEDAQMANDTENDVERMQGLKERQIDAIVKGLPPRFKDLTPDFALFDEIMDKKQSLLLTGSVGTGKTRKMFELLIPYLLHKHFHIAYYMMDEDIPPISEKMVRRHFKTISEALREIKDEFDNPHAGSIMDFMIATDVLFLDDLGVEHATDWVKEQLYTVINERYNWMRPVVLSTNLSFKEIAENYGDRFASRLVEMCKKLEFTGKDWRVQK